MIDIRSFSVVMLLFMFTYTILGLEFFAFKAKLENGSGSINNETGISPVFNFDNFLNAFFTVFIVITNDG